MSKYLIDAALDAALAYVAECTRMDVTSDSSTPTNLTNTLGNITLTAGAGNGDYTLANGDVSGRKLTIAAQSGFNATATGTARHQVFSLSGTIRFVTTLTEQAVTSGNPLTTAAIDLELRDVA